MDHIGWTIPETTLKLKNQKKWIGLWKHGFQQSVGKWRWGHSQITNNMFKKQ